MVRHSSSLLRLEARKCNPAVPDAQKAGSVVSPNQVHIVFIHGQGLYIVAEIPAVAVIIQRRRFRVTDSQRFAETLAAIARNRRPDVIGTVGISRTPHGPSTPSRGYAIQGLVTPPAPGSTGDRDEIGPLSAAVIARGHLVVRTGRRYGAHHGVSAGRGGIRDQIADAGTAARPSRRAPRPAAVRQCSS